jgi:hypothetical protein
VVGDLMRKEKKDECNKLYLRENQEKRREMIG